MDGALPVARQEWGSLLTLQLPWPAWQVSGPRERRMLPAWPLLLPPGWIGGRAALMLLYSKEEGGKAGGAAPIPQAWWLGLQASLALVTAWIGNHLNSTYGASHTMMEGRQAGDKM